MTMDYDETDLENKENKNNLEFIFFFILCVTDVSFILYSEQLHDEEHIVLLRSSFLFFKMKFA